MIYLMRHGKDDETRFGGWSVYGLTDEGRAQAERAAESLVGNGISHIFLSDLARARETAEIAGKRLSLSVYLLPEFREVNNGVLAGMPKTEAAEKYPGLWFASLDFDEPYPSGESPATFYKRICLAWTNFKIVASENEMTPLLVTHGGVINAILCIENGAEFTNKSLTYRIPHAGIVEIK